MLALSILVLAFVIWWHGWKLVRGVALIAMILERVANRSALRSGQPPVTTDEDVELFKSTL